MASSGNADLFKSGAIGIVDNKLQTGNEDLFKSGFAKSEIEETNDVKSLQQKSQMKESAGEAQDRHSKRSTDKKSSVKSNQQKSSKKKSAAGEGSPEVSAERSIDQSKFRTMSNFRNSQMSQNRSEKKSRQGSTELTPAERVANMSPIKGAKISAPRFNYALDNEEREIIAKGKDLSKQEIWALLEKKRFAELKKASVNLQGKLLINSRCPKCTLIPPCKHYSSP